MTTHIKIDAHAGWNVEVEISELVQKDSQNFWSTRKEIVKAMTAKDFYIHSHMRISLIREIPHE